MAESRATARRALGGRQRRPGARDARRRQDVEERHAEGPAAGRPRAEHRGVAARDGPAYIAVYRFLFEHDLKPYIYTTDDYGATWTKLTDGTNGIPDDHPTRVVREDPEQPGLLYAGTEFGFFVSLNNGADWQPLQQNLPATPVTDLRVHRGDLVISTMGARSGSWTTCRRCGSWRLPRSTSSRYARRAGAGAARPRRGRVSVPLDAAARSTSRKPTLSSRPTASAIARPAVADDAAGGPEYPPVALPIDYFLPAGFKGDVTLEISRREGSRRSHRRPGGAGTRHGWRAEAAAAIRTIPTCAGWPRPRRRAGGPDDEAGAQPVHVGLPLGERRTAGGAGHLYREADRRGEQRVSRARSR